jgi:hypothetical protein
MSGRHGEEWASLEASCMDGCSGGMGLVGASCMNRRAPGERASVAQAGGGSSRRKRKCSQGERFLFRNSAQ